MKIGKFEPFT